MGGVAVGRLWQRLRRQGHHLRDSGRRTMVGEVHHSLKKRSGAPRGKNAGDNQAKQYILVVDDEIGPYAE